MDFNSLNSDNVTIKLDLLIKMTYFDLFLTLERRNYSEFVRGALSPSDLTYLAD